MGTVARSSGITLIAIVASLASCGAALSFVASAVGETPPPDRVAAAEKLHPSLDAGINAGQPRVAAWVMFTDKGVRTPAEFAAALQRVAESCDPRAVQRRRWRRSRPGLFDEHDLPVAPEYVTAVAATGVRVRVVSRWVNAVSVDADRAQLAAIAELPFVRQVQAVRRSCAVDPARDSIEKPDRPTGATPAGPDGPFYGRSAEQLAQINLIALHDLGHTAAGVVIGVLDTGFHRAHDAFNQPSHPLNVVAEWDFINNDPNTGIEPGDPPGQHSHGTLILGTLAAYLPNELVGGAYDASFILCKTEDISGEYQAEEDYYVAGLEFIEAHGGDVATSSLGYIDWYTQADLDGRTAVTTIGVNVATANGVHCCTAAGNSGHDADPETSHLIAPADAFRVIACGAVSGEGSIVGFSSDGPSADGRVKPELLARGARTSTVDPDNPQGFAQASGTSLSTPLVASAVACLAGARPAWSVDLLRARMFHSAGYFVANRTFDPLFVEGYGIVNARDALVMTDCNGNGVDDFNDIALGTSTDFNANNVPDECRDLGDLNCDAVIDERDAAAFAVALVDPAAHAAAYPHCPIRNGDGNGDGVVNGDDIRPIVAILLGP